MLPETENIFWSFYHQSAKNNEKGHPPILWDVDLWPEQWKKIEYKTYDRFKKIPLPRRKKEQDFFELIKKRKSRRNFSSEPLGADEISMILEYSCGITGPGSSDSFFHRAQASGGGRFPIETYLFVHHGNEEIPGGVYHYGVERHELHTLWAHKFSPNEVNRYFMYPWAECASVSVLLTAVFERTMMKYGERGYRYILLEAGHIGQNVYLVSEALGLKCCALGGVRDTAIEELLDIDTSKESLVYSLAVGK